MVARLRGRPTPTPPEEQPTEETSNTTQKSGASKILVAVTAISLLGMIGAGGYVWSQQNSSGGSHAGTETSKHGEEHASTHSQAGHDTTGPIHNLGPFVVNLGSLDNQHYLRIAVSLDFKVNDSHFVGQSSSNKEHWLGDFKEILKQREPVLKDVVVTTLSSRAPETLNSLPGKEDLKAELIARFNQHFQENAIVQQVYFTDFVIQ